MRNLTAFRVMNKNEYRNVAVFGNLAYRVQPRFNMFRSVRTVITDSKPEQMASTNNWLADGVTGDWVKGLGGAQASESVSVIAPVGVQAAGEGDVTANVTWVAPDGTKQTSNYTLSMVKENNKWLVKKLS